MILEFPSQNASLASYLHARALTATTRRLALDIAIGIAVTGTSVWLHSRGWIMFASVGACFAMYGAWAFAERRLEMDMPELSQATESAWTVLRGVAAILGLGAALIFTFSLAAATLGTWIS